MHIPKRAVFLDRDGTLNEEVNYLHRPEDFVWIPGAPDAVRRLNEAGLLVLVVTNQAGVARGYYTEADVHRLHAYMQELLAPEAHIDGFYHCPYHPEGVVEGYRRVSPCRKPAPGMFEEAIEAWGLDPALAFVVGDKNSDVEPGKALGMTTFLVETGYGREARQATRADYIVPDIGEAVTRIVSLCEATSSI